MKANEQPDLIKEIRLNIGSLTSAVDAELEESVEQFVNWWETIRELRKRIAYCRAVPTAESNPSRLRDDAPHQ
jgi:hypothetical protein